MPVDEPLGARAQRCVGIVSAVEHIVGDFLGHVPGPPFDGVEGDDPQRVPVLPRNHVADDRPEIGFSEVCLSERPAQVAEVLNDNVGRDVIFGVQWGHDTQLSQGPRCIIVATPQWDCESVVSGLYGHVIPPAGTTTSRPASQSARTECLRGLDGWHKIKHDGYRLQVRRDGDTVRLFTRRGYDWSGRYPAIVMTAMQLRATSFTLDGEAVVCGPDGVAIFDALHRRGTVSEAMLYVFDLLALEGQDLRALPLGDRKKRLARLLGKRHLGIVLSEQTDEDGALNLPAGLQAWPRRYRVQADERALSVGPVPGLDQGEESE
jgi:hypothetical protein